MSPAPIIIANWKMHKTASQASAFISALRGEMNQDAKCRVWIAAPFTAIEAAVSASLGSPLLIGGQNMHDQSQGAFTGEISADMLKSSGAGFVLLGHSERRHLFGETNAFICRKLVAALQEGLMPVLCVGEHLEHRESSEHESVLKSQLENCLEGIDSDQVAPLVIAYEPIWAIGTGKTATPQIAQAAHNLIRQWLEGRFGKERAKKIPLLYGGSVKSDNIGPLMEQSEIDGALVGGASLDVASFAQIINYRGSR